MKTRILSLLFILLALTACKKTIDPEISLDNRTASMGPDGGSATVALTSNCTWSAASSQDGVTISPVNGDGDASVTVTVPKNTTGETVSIRVTFTAKGTEKSATAKFVVTQTANAFVNFPVAAGTIGAAGGGGRIVLEANEAWTATVSATGIAVTPDSGLLSETLAYTVPANTTGSPVVHTVTVALVGDPSVKTTFTLTQSN